MFPVAWWLKGSRCLSQTCLDIDQPMFNTWSNPLTTWECLGILWAIPRTSRGIRFKNTLGIFDIWDSGDCGMATLMRLWMQGNNFKVLEARPHWSAKCRSQGNIFRHLDRELLCLGACGLDSRKDSQSFEEWSERGLDLELDRSDLILKTIQWESSVIVPILQMRKPRYRKIKWLGGHSS